MRELGTCHDCVASLSTPTPGNVASWCITTHDQTTIRRDHRFHSSLHAFRTLHLASSCYGPATAERYAQVVIFLAGGSGTEPVLPPCPPGRLTLGVASAMSCIQTSNRQNEQFAQPHRPACTVYVPGLQADGDGGRGGWGSCAYLHSIRVKVPILDGWRLGAPVTETETASH